MNTVYLYCAALAMFPVSIYAGVYTSGQESGNSYRLTCPAEVIFTEDFGSGISNPGPELPPGTTTYCYENLQGSCPANAGITPGSIDDGSYSIMNDPSTGIISSTGATDIWASIDDHTPDDTSGYMLVVNAGFEQEEFYRLNNIPVFPGEEYTFSAWFANILSPVSVMNCGAGQVPVNVNFVVEDAGTGAVLGSLSSGDIFSNGQAEWVSAEFVFTASSPFVNIVLVNNAPGGCGNDFAIDDIELTGCVANTTTAVDDFFMGCEAGGIQGNVLLNDIDEQGDEQMVTAIHVDLDGDLVPETWVDVDATLTIGGMAANLGAVADFGQLTVLTDGSLLFMHEPANLPGLALLEYVVCDDGIPQACDTAMVEITVTCDTVDCPPVLHTETYNGCSGDGYSIIVDGTVFSESNPMGEVTFTNGASSGCDSIVAVELNFAPNAFGTFTNTACEGSGYSIVVNGTVYDESNPNGTEVLQGAAANNCDSTVTINLAFEPSAIGIDFEVSPAIAAIGPGQSVFFTSDPSNGAITWSPDLFLSCSDCPDPTATPEYSVQYIISLNQGGCLAYDTVFVVVEEPQVYIPTAFSPNGDSDNDIFQVIDKNFQEFIFLRVYNRWGELLYETDDLNSGWDGTYEGAEQEMDTYIYHIRVVDFFGEKTDLQGMFLLLR